MEYVVSWHAMFGKYFPHSHTKPQHQMELVSFTPWPFYALTNI